MEALHHVCDNIYSTPYTMHTHVRNCEISVVPKPLIFFVDLIALPTSMPFLQTPAPYFACWPNGQGLGTRSRRFQVQALGGSLRRWPAKCDHEIIERIILGRHKTSKSGRLPMFREYRHSCKHCFAHMSVDCPRAENIYFSEKHGFRINRIQTHPATYANH